MGRRDLGDPPDRSGAPPLRFPPRSAGFPPRSPPRSAGFPPRSAGRDPPRSPPRSAGFTPRSAGRDPPRSPPRSAGFPPRLVGRDPPRSPPRSAGFPPRLVGRDPPRSPPRSAGFPPRSAGRDPLRSPRPCPPAAPDPSLRRAAAPLEEPRDGPEARASPGLDTWREWLSREGCASSFRGGRRESPERPVSSAARGVRGPLCLRGPRVSPDWRGSLGRRLPPEERGGPADPRDWFPLPAPPRSPGFSARLRSEEPALPPERPRSCPPSPFGARPTPPDP